MLSQSGLERQRRSDVYEKIIMREIARLTLTKKRCHRLDRVSWRPADASLRGDILKGTYPDTFPNRTSVGFTSMKTFSSMIVYLLTMRKRP